MSGIPCKFGNTGGAGGGNRRTRISCFVKLNTLLTNTTTLVDLDGGSVGYLRLVWDPSAFFRLEGAYRGGSTTIFLCPSFTVVPGGWYWISGSIESYNVGGLTGPHTMRLYGQVWGPSGATPGVQTGTFDATVDGDDVVNCGLGWGVPLSSSWNYFPYAVGDEMTELYIETWDTSSPSGPLGQPSVPLTVASGGLALYHCDEPLGQDRIIHDASSGHYDLTPPSPQPGASAGDRILADSPF